MEDNARKTATITVSPQPIITTVTIQPHENPPTSAEPGVTYVQVKPGHFTTIPGILKLVQIVSSGTDAGIHMLCGRPYVLNICVFARRRLQPALQRPSLLLLPYKSTPRSQKGPGQEYSRQEKVAERVLSRCISSKYQPKHRNTERPT